MEQIILEETANWGNVHMPERLSRVGRLLLVVDDEALICWALKERLSAAGYQVVAASDAATALGHFRDGAGNEPVDLVVLDFKLPDMDGLRLFKEIRQLKPNCPAILMTAFGTPEQTADAQRLGIYRVLNKPFGLDEIITLVGEALAAPTASATSPQSRQRSPVPRV